MPQSPPPDDLDRDAFYASGSEETDDYELEPPDETIRSVEQLHTETVAAAVARNVDADEIMREQERLLDFQLIDQWIRELRFQFQIKHLLWTTAAVALLVASAQYSLWASSLLAVLMTVGGMLAFLSKKERLHQAAIIERRRQQYKGLPAAGGNELSAVPTASDAMPPSLMRELINSLSLWEVLVAAGIAAAFLAMLGITFGSAAMATCLGLLALAGFLVQILGIDLPWMVAMVWWELLILYVLVSVVLTISGRF